MFFIIITVICVLAKDLIEVVQSLYKNIPSANHALVEGYKQCKSVILSAPFTALKYAVFQTGCMIVPGMYGSKYLADNARILGEEMDAARYGVESPEVEKNRLVEQFNKSDKSKFSKNDIRGITSVIQEIHTWGVTVRRLLTLERALAMPRETKLLRADVEGKRFKDMFQANMYDPVVCRQLYEYIALTATGLKYGVHVSRRVPYLQGPPGTGKTRMVQEMARTLDIPYLSIIVGKEYYIDEILFGREPKFGDTPIGTITEFVSRQNSWPIIVHFDEIDRLLNSDDVPTIRQYFLRLLNSGEDDHMYKCHGINGMDFDSRKMLCILSGNDYIRDTTTTPEDKESVSSCGEDQAFKDRLHIIRFDGYTAEQKRGITKTLMKNTLSKFGNAFELKDSTKHAIEEMIEKDSNPGVRVLKAEICHRIVMDVAEQDGWVY